MPFYNYRQNNSGGHFDYSEDHGIAVNVIVEATDADDANRRAETIGLYWDGCNDGRDCSCCGDRWHPAWRDESGTDVPKVYSRPVVEGMTYRELHGDSLWARWRLTPADRADVFIHYADGRIVAAGQGEAAPRT